MKIGGVKVTSSEEVLVLPRNEENIVFKAKAVSINDDFDRLCPVPNPPMIITKEGKQPDFTDANYKQQMAIRDEKRFAYMMLRSLEPSQIEWEQVNLEAPNTWLGWTQELIDAGLSDVEVNRVIGIVMTACSLDEEKIEQARADFLRGQGE